MEKTFRTAFLEALEKSGLSIAQVAENSGVSVEQLKKLKQRDTAKTNVEDARRVARCFGQSLDDFVNDPAVEAQVEIVSLYTSLPEPLRKELLSYGKGLAASQKTKVR
ncbi:helix-turn-helix domain-containing protein [Marinovum algicola]|uniref:helix-turn-helix domain-containing protein n=1 Tax=Marinovum algicola TaxID=42444 RepID=UPI003B52E449